MEQRARCLEDCGRGARPADARLEEGVGTCVTSTSGPHLLPSAEQFYFVTPSLVTEAGEQQAPNWPWRTVVAPWPPWP